MNTSRNKLNIALIAGGDSGEYEVSINSAKAVADNLNRDIYNVFFIHMRGLNWHYIDDKETQYPIDKNDFSITINGEKITFDVAFIIIHGTPGEDGKLQSYLDLLQIPYTSSDSYTSSATFKKDFTKYIAHDLGINVAQTICIRRNEVINPASLVEKVGLPCFVKPNKGGSSVGISKVEKTSDLLKAIEVAFDEDDEILVEEALNGIEVGCGVFQVEGEITTLPLTEIVSQTAFFDYEAKYNGASEEITPARIDKTKTEECQAISKFLYQKFNCKGVVRFDYILQDNTFYFLEVNTIPGLSKASIIPQQLRCAGLSAADIYHKLIQEAVGTYKKR